MLINLESQPRQHFIDSLEVGFIAFVRRDAHEPSAEQSDENVDKFLCDVTPAPENAMSAGSEAVHRRLVQFFTGPANRSRSAQPFSKIVERLEESSATSTYLKAKLSEYKLSKVCATSAVSKELSILDDLGCSPSPRRSRTPGPKCAKTRRPPATFTTRWEKRTGFSGTGSAGAACWSTNTPSRTDTSPTIFFYYAVLFVALFWILLKFDKTIAAIEDGPKKLGLTYAIDMLVPLGAIAIGSAEHKCATQPRAAARLPRFPPSRRSILAVLVFLFIYRAAR